MLSFASPAGAAGPGMGGPRGEGFRGAAAPQGFEGGAERFVPQPTNRIAEPLMFPWKSTA